MQKEIIILIVIMRLGKKLCYATRADVEAAYTNLPDNYSTDEPESVV